MNHTDVLNYLINSFNLKSYLEIGIFKPENNFNKINCKAKVGIDPAIKTEIDFDSNVCLLTDTSNSYFERNKPGIFKNFFDLIFIDGLHEASQVKKDFENSLNCLNQGGFIVLHDTCPERQEFTCMPRGNQKIWTGDVWKFAFTLCNYKDIRYATFDFDHGCTVVWRQQKTSNKKTKIPELTWGTYIEKRSNFLNIITFEQFELQTVFINPV